MSILGITTDVTGQIGVVPQEIYINTNDTLATVTTAGYLNEARNQGYQFSNQQLAHVYGTDFNSGTPGCLDFQVSVPANPLTGNYSLVDISGSAGGITSVSGTTNRITSSGGTAPVIDISASYVGQSSIMTLGTITSGTWNGTTIATGHGGTGVTSVTTVPTATNFAGWDTHKNLSANNLIEGYSTTVASVGTTTLTVSSAAQQYFTGTSVQTVVLPVTSTLALGQSFYIVNNASQVVTVQTSGGNVIKAMAAGSTLSLTCILTSGTSAASWSAQYNSNAAAVTSVTGTTGRITSTGGTAPIINLDTGYLGQSSITTLGTIATGIWNATAVGPLHGGTGVANTAGNTLTINAPSTINQDVSTAGSPQFVDVSAGTSGTAGTIYSYPATASQGKFGLAAQGSPSGDFVVTVQNDQVGQSTLLTIPDTGTSTGTFILNSVAGGSQQITSGNLVVSGGALITGAPTGSGGSITTYSSTALKGSLNFTCTDNAGDYDIFVANDSMGQITSVKIPDPLQGSAAFALAPNALVDGNLIKASGTTGLIVDAGISAPATIVSSVATGTGISGGPITSTGTVSLATRVANSLMGNPTGSSATPSDITLGTGLAFSGTTLEINPNAINYVKVSMSQSDIFSMYAAPKLIVPAAGAHTFIAVQKFALEFVWGSVQYTGGGTTALQYGNTVHGAGIQAASAYSSATIDGLIANTLFSSLAVIIAPTASASLVNTGLYMSNGSVGYANGDSTFNVHVWYSVITTIA